MNAELVNQIQTNYVSLSVFLIASAIFLGTFACAAIAITRMIQLYIATNLTITRELAVIKNSMIVPAQPGAPQAMPFTMPSSAPAPGMQPGEPGKPSPEGEILGYDEAEMADQETIRILRAQKKADGGMSDEAWQAEIDRVNAAGFKAESV
jgi:hypothetical protein